MLARQIGVTETLREPAFTRTTDRICDPLRISTEPNVYMGSRENGYRREKERTTAAEAGHAICRGMGADRLSTGGQKRELPRSACESRRE